MPLKRTSGIYAIVNTINGRRYIGQSVDIETRWRGHRSDLTHRRHGNPHLQNAWNFHGATSFVLQVLEVVEKAQLNEREMYWIDQWMATKKEAGYNCRLGGQYGGIPDAETRQRMSESAKRKAAPSLTTRQRMRDAQYARPPVTEATRQKISAALMGHHVAPETARKTVATRRALGTYTDSEETRQKKSIASKGRIVSEETRRKIGDAHRGTTLSPEARQKLSVAATLRFASEEERKRTGEAVKRALESPTIREKIRAGKTGKESPLARAHRERLAARPVSEETRQKMSLAHKAQRAREREAKTGEARK